MSDFNPYFDKMRNRARMFIFIPIAIIAFALLIGWVVMWLWNAILPDLLGVNIITYWQAVGLLVLCRILFGGFGGRKGGGSNWGRGRKGGGRTSAQFRQRWMQMSAEERARFKEEWRERCRKRDSN